MYYQAWLKAGLHRVRIVRPALGRVVYDGEVLVNGLDTVAVRLGRCDTPADACAVTVRKGIDVIFEGSSRGRP